VDQLKEVETLQPPLLFLGLSGINQQSLLWRGLVRTRPTRGCRCITRQKASNDAEWLHVADAVSEATDAPEHWPSL